MKKSIWIRIIIYGILACVSLYVYRFRIYDLINKIAYNDYAMEELTEEQKIEDFEYIYSNMVNSIPFLEEIKELYQIDFEGRKEYYLEEIRSTNNNFEFYCTLKAIMRDIPSFHTDLCFPLYSHLLGLHCYDSSNQIRSPGTKARIDAWTKEIEEAIYEYEKIAMINVSYIDGSYIVEANYLSDAYQGMEGYELLSIDGVSADAYVVENISAYGLYYDFQYEKPYRSRYTFNDSVGQPVKVVWKDLQGKQVEQTLYLDRGAEIVANYGWLFSDDLVNYNISEESIVIHRDEENRLEYIRVNSFSNAKGKELKKYLKDTPYDKIIIDLRSNSGGYSSYAKDYLYPMLYERDVTFSYQWKVPNTEENKAMTRDWVALLNYFPSKDDEFYYYENTVKYEGQAKKDKEVYYLMGKGSGSATDNFLQLVKQNNLGVIVGTNSGGEGLGASYICSSLPNSSLIYVYYPSIPIETDGKYSVCGGVMPDVYVGTSIEDYKLQQKYEKEGTASEYDKRLQYDTVLKWVINQE